MTAERLPSKQTEFVRVIRDFGTRETSTQIKMQIVAEKPQFTTMDQWASTWRG